MAEQHHPALLHRQGSECRPELGRVLDRDAGGFGRPVDQLDAGTLPPPGQPDLVDMTVDDGPPGIGLHVAGPVHSVPASIQPDQRPLNDVLGLMRTTTEEVREPEQAGSFSRHEGREFHVPTRPHPVLPSSALTAGPSGPTALLTP